MSQLVVGGCIATVRCEEKHVRVIYELHCFSFQPAAAACRAACNLVLLPAKQFHGSMWRTLLNGVAAEFKGEEGFLLVEVA